MTGHIGGSEGRTGADVTRVVLSEGDRRLVWCSPSPKLHLGVITGVGNGWVTARAVCGRPVTAVLERAEWRDGRVCRRCYAKRPAEVTA